MSRLATPAMARGRVRLTAGLLLVLMALGSFALWVGIPIGCLWVVSKLTESSATHFVLALPVTIAAMALFAPVLVWINRLYMRVLYATWIDEDADDGEEPQPLRGPLEPLLLGSLVLAIVVMMIWFFIFAENPPSCASSY